MNIRYKLIKTKQHSKVTDLGCMLEETISGEPMTLEVINKINGKLNFSLRKIDILQKHSADCSTIFFSYYTLIMPVQSGTLLLIKKQKRK